MPLSTLTNRRMSNWPLTLRPLAWFYAHPRFLTFNGASTDEVTSWRCRTGATVNTISTAGASYPFWRPGGWRPGVASLDFDGAASFLTTTSGPLATLMNGADVPFSCLMTARIDASADHGILRWYPQVGLALSHWRTNNTPPEVSRYVRTDDVAGSVTVTGTLDMGTTNNRFGLIFPGTTASTYRGRDLDIAAAACNVGTLTADTFEFGRTAIGQLDAAVTELLILPRAITDAEYQAYVYYSLGEFG